MNRKDSEVVVIAKKLNNKRVAKILSGHAKLAQIKIRNYKKL